MLKRGGGARWRSRWSPTTSNRLKQCRAIATSYEKLAETYHAPLTLATIRLWLPV